MTPQNDKPSRLSIRLTPPEAQFVRRLSDTLRISRSQVIKQSLAHFELLLSDQNDPNVCQTSDTLARAHGIYTSFIRYKRTTYPPPSVPEGATSTSPRMKRRKYQFPIQRRTRRPTSQIPRTIHCSKNGGSSIRSTRACVPTRRNADKRGMTWEPTTDSTPSWIAPNASRTPSHGKTASFPCH